MALAAICAGFTFTSCSNDIDDIAGSAGQILDPNHGALLSITKVGTNGMTNVTRATATEVGTWATAPDKNIGVSVYSSTDGTEAMKAGATNMKWTYNVGTSAWETQTPLAFFPGDEGVVSAYYPYSETADPTAVDIDATKDYMYALIDDNKAVSYNSTQVALQMHHANTQIRVNLVRRGYAGPGTVSSFSVKGSKFASAAKMNSLTGELSDFTSLSEIAGSAVTLADDVNSTPGAKIETVYSWFVPVSDEAAPVTFDATVDGLKLRYTTNQQFLSGKRYTFNLAVTDNLADNFTLTSVEVDPWSDADATDGDMDLFVPIKKGQENGYDWVDLGLPSGLKWATCNIGATSETDSGLYFMWGDTEGHTKDSGYEFTDANYTAKGLNAITSELTLEQDAAHAALGGDWRMPTKADYYELISRCNVTWTDDYEGSGVAGKIFTSKTNGETLFLPAVGYLRGTLNIGTNTRQCFYWNSSSHPVNSSYGFYFYGTSSSSNQQAADYRFSGFSVRAVCQ